MRSGYLHFQSQLVGRSVGKHDDDHGHVMMILLNGLNDQHGDADDDEEDDKNLEAGGQGMAHWRDPEE